MIAYEDLVTSLNSWRARNGLPTTPPDYGDPAPVAYTDVAEEGAPDEVYDLSDDSGLIMTEDLAQADEVGVIETAAEIAQTADEAVSSEYDDPPGTDDYGDVAAAQTVDAESGEEMPDVTANDVEALPDEQAADDDVANTEAYDEPPVDTVDVDDAGVIEEQAVGETLEADADGADEPDDIDAADIMGDEPLPTMDDDVDLDGETVVAGEPGESGEPEALPDVPGPNDEPKPE